MGQRIRGAGDKWAHVGSMPACLAVTTERAFAGPFHSAWSASLPRLQTTWSRLVCVMVRWMTAFLWRLRTWSYRVLWLTPPSCHRPLHATPDSERMRNENGWGGQGSLPRRASLVRQPVWTSCGGLCRTSSQKSSQAMRHFLPKRTSSSAASSCPKPAPTQQPVKPMP